MLTMSIQDQSHRAAMDLHKRMASTKSLILAIIFCVASLSLTVDASRHARGVMLSMPAKRDTDCMDRTTVEKNATSSIILTGTVKDCNGRRAGSYKCRVRIWRIMKGKKLAQDLVTSMRQGAEGLIFKHELVDIYGLGNILYCDSDVGDEDTRIFFLNRINNRLVLSASLVHITLANLENTQAVIEGKNVVDPPKKKPDPCMNVLCGFGASCTSSEDGNANCLCPPVSCSSDFEDELFAPLCGSDGITYPNECRLRAAECMAQRRIRVVEEKPCAKPSDRRPNKPNESSLVDSDNLDPESRAPVVDRGLCTDVECANSAECLVRIQPDGTSAPSCVCPTCDRAPVLPLCGSDQLSHRSECDMRRAGCLQGVEITAVRPLPCNPCEVFNETSQQFENSCPGVCALSEAGEAVCCDTFPCVDDGEVVCGSDGNNYASRCALRRQACKTARNLSVIKQGLCPLKNVMTTVRGSMAIDADAQCPGNCDPQSTEFEDFVGSLENTVNEDLQQKNLDSDFDSDEVLTLGEFKVTGTRRGSVVLLFKAYASTRSLVINEGDLPDSNTAWIYARLFAPVDGALVVAARTLNVTLAIDRDPSDDFIVEDVCLTEQCTFGASCNIAMSGSRFKPSCSCDNLGEPERLPVTHACKLAADGDGEQHTFVNRWAARLYACNARVHLTFKDVCQGGPVDPCAGQGGCHGEGQSCVVINGVPMCECITCNDVYQPVCTADKQTFKSACEVHRHNCLTSGNLVISNHDGPCVNQCDGVTCAPGEQCEVVNNGAVCFCPSTCIAARSPVCGTDGVTYDNECELVVAACKSHRNVTVQYAGECDDGARVDQSGQGSGNGEDDEDGCNCMYGAVCVTTLDDEDASCVCDISCANSPPGEMLCGSDGKTYANACELMKAQCEEQKTIKIASRGSCEAACENSRYKCCEDGVTPAKGLQRSGCPEKCNCNEFGSYERTCNQTTGQCVCRPGVGGLKCDRCLPGFWNFVAVAKGQIAGCMACRCNPLGSTRDDCDQMTGRCSCKENVSGAKCTHCVNGDEETWITSDLCEQVAQSHKSCGDLSCRAGQDCVDNGSGSFECRCPTLSSCNSFSGGSVCGSNGITYADECQMRVITCKEGIDVRIASEGPCIDQYEPLVEVPAPKPSTTIHITTTEMRTTTLPPTTTLLPTTTEPKPTTSPKPTPEPTSEPVPEPEPTTKPTTTMATTSARLTTMEPSAAPEPSTTVAPSTPMEPSEPAATPEPSPSVEPSSEPEPTTTKSSTTTMVTETSTEMVVSSDETGSGCMGDDEDGCTEGSGEDETASESPVTTSTQNTDTTTEAPVTGTDEKPTQAPLMFNGTAEFYSVPGQRVSYNKDLGDTSSEQFAEYSNLISSEVMALAAKDDLHGKVMTFSIKAMTPVRYFFSVGVKVHYELGLAPGTDPLEIEEALNRLSRYSYSFELSVPTGRENLFVHDWPFSPLDGAEEELEGYGGFVPDYKRTIAPSPETPTIYEEDTEWSVPQFGGASYAEFPSITSVTATAIELRFRSFDSEGLLFYAGTTNRESDFISLAVHKGYLEFRFDTGSGVLNLRSRRPLDDGEWHNIVARRNRREGMLQVDDDPHQVHGTSPGSKQGLNLDSNVYIGGFHAAYETRINNQVGVEKGLTGCISSVTIDNLELVLNSSSRNCINAHRIAECGSSPCFPNQCRNSANCFITKQGDVFTNKCECKGPFEGATCDRPATRKAIDPCIGHQCHELATCVPSENGDGYTCLCSPGRSGSLCMDAESRVGGPSFMPAFAEDSYLQFDPLGSDVAASMTVEVLFYTSQPDGLIFYDEQKKTARTKRDFVALNIKGRYLEFMYDLGQGMAKIRSHFPISLNEWHVARLTRDNRHGQMTVDKGQPAKGVSPHLHSELNVDQPLFLGGVPDYAKLPKAAGITTGLVGAIQTFEVNGMPLTLAPGGGVVGYNVQAFNAHACYHSPCENGGTCYPRGADFSCVCPQGFAGTRCDIRRLSGSSVDTVLRDEGETAVYFDGKSIGRYRNAVKEKDSKNNFLPTSRATRHNVYELVLRTTARHGLLLMAGKAIDNRDYLALTITDGRAHLRFNLGSGPAHVISEERINDNRFHVIKVEREFTRASLSVDNGIPQTVESQGNTRELNTDGFVLIGGIDYRPRGVGQYKSFHHFVGCIFSFKIHDEAVSLRDDALNTPYLRSCLDR